MSKQEKLLNKLFHDPSPRDFTWVEACTLLDHLGYKLVKVGGSGRKFYDRETNRLLLPMHEPHPGNTLKAYQVKQLRQAIAEDGKAPR